MLGGQNRKSPPRPFSRPSVSLVGSGQHRAWKRVRAAQVAVGDTLAEGGLVHDTQLGGTPWTVKIWAGERKQPLYFTPGEKVHAFTEASEDDTGPDPL